VKALPVSLGADERRIDGKAVAADQPFGDAALNRLLEQLAKKVTVAKAAVPVLGSKVEWSGTVPSSPKRQNQR
jgi:hypothetical protein